VNKIRLLGDFAHSTRIAFIEFGQAEGAMAALNCSGAQLGASRRGACARALVRAPSVGRPVSRPLPVPQPRSLLRPHACGV
jgi:hypothetical protein